jgi:catechol 2,3-dioxygenase-like lactoylglutathione lyase family enzyme
MPNSSTQKLNAYPIVAFLTTSDPAKAKSFFGDTLGLQFVSEDGFAVVFNGRGTSLRISIVPKVTPAQYTVLGWEVPEIASAAQELVAAGVTLEKFPGMGQDELGVWTAPGGAAKVVWFKDPDGNVLSLSQH